MRIMGSVPIFSIFSSVIMRAMQRVPLAEFEPALKKRREELWGAPPNLYRALGNHPQLTAAWTEVSRGRRDGGAQLPRLRLRDGSVRHGAAVLEFHRCRQAGGSRPAAAR